MSDHIILQPFSKKSLAYKVDDFTPICQELISYLQEHEDKICKLKILYKIKDEIVHFTFNLGFRWGEIVVTEEAINKLVNILDKFIFAEKYKFEVNPIDKSIREIVYHELNEEGIIAFNILNKPDKWDDNYLLEKIYGINPKLFIISKNKPTSKLYFARSKTVKTQIMFIVKLSIYDIDVKNNLPLLVEFFTCCQDHIFRG